MSSRIRPRPRSTGWSATSASTGSGCRRGDRRRSPRTAASSSARSASTSEPARPRAPRAGAVTRRVEVAPQRFAGWVSSFAERHGGGLTAEPGSETVGFGAADGALARCLVPFPPLECADAVPADDARRIADAGPADDARRIADAGPADDARRIADAGPADDARPADLARRIAEHACADRTVGVLLVRRGGYAAGVFTGTGPSLAASKVGSRLVQGRSAAGGQSQRRFRAIRVALTEPERAPAGGYTRTPRA